MGKYIGICGKYSSMSGKYSSICGQSSGILGEIKQYFCQIHQYLGQINQYLGQIQSCLGKYSRIWTNAVFIGQWSVSGHRSDVSSLHYWPVATVSEKCVVPVCLL